jgi:Tetratricopeptide repeat
MMANTTTVKLLLQALKVHTHVSETEHPDTLTAITSLASKYWQQGRIAEAVKLNEEVLGKWRRILGDEHPYTISAMEWLGGTYRDEDNCRTKFPS